MVERLSKYIILFTIFLFFYYYSVESSYKKNLNFEVDNNMLNVFLSNVQKHIKNLEKLKTVLVVLGNETCDLDSAISSLIFSLFLHHQSIPDSIVIPVFNIQREQLPVKTEVMYVLKKHSVNLDNVVCRDDIDLNSLQDMGSLQLTLVDHHVLSHSDHELAKSVVSVIDHRPQDPAWPWEHVDLTLRTVGSCCTLVADKLLTQAPDLVSPMVAELLLGTILLDTACLSPVADRATALDLQVVEQLIASCVPGVDNTRLFSELQTAKSDISSLTSAQLLIKDLKVAAGIPIVGLPIKVKEFLKQSDALTAVKQFCKEHKFGVCVVYGAGIERGTLTRDIAVFSQTNKDAATLVLASLTCFLDLEPQDCSLEGFTLFEQLNIKVTRKQILPIIQQVGEKLRSS